MFRVNDIVSNYGARYKVTQINPLTRQICEILSLNKREEIVEAPTDEGWPDRIFKLVSRNVKRKVM